MILIKMEVPIAAVHRKVIVLADPAVQPYNYPGESVLEHPVIPVEFVKVYPAGSNVTVAVPGAIPVAPRPNCTEYRTYWFIVLPLGLIVNCWDQHWLTSRTRKRT